MIETGNNLEKMMSKHASEKFRKDVSWTFEIESVGESHLVKHVEIPELGTFDGKLVPVMGDHVKVVFSLNSADVVEKKIAGLMTLPGQVPCKACFTMFAPDGSDGRKMKVASTWIFEGFRPEKIKLQSFDRSRPASIVELMVSFSFTSARIV